MRLPVDGPGTTSPSQQSTPRPVAATPQAMAPMEHEALRPEFRQFLARQQRSSMLVNNQWKPVTTDGATWAAMSPEEREKLTELPTHTFTMTDFESDRIRQEIGGDTAMYGSNAPAAYRADPLERVADPVHSRELTWEQYDKLAEAERAVVDFNSDFLSARAKDFENQETYKKTVTPEQREKYNSMVDDIFGGQGGSEFYAPTVVSLLAQADFSAVGQDLDEYLNLDRLITADEIKDLPATIPKPKSYGGFIGSSGPVDMEEYKEIRTEEYLAALDVAITAEYAKKIEQVMRMGRGCLPNSIQTIQCAGGYKKSTRQGIGPPP